MAPRDRLKCTTGITTAGSRARKFAPADAAPRSGMRSITRRTAAERNVAWTRAGFTALDHNRDNQLTSNEWHFDVETFRRIDRDRNNVGQPVRVPRRSVG